MLLAKIYGVSLSQFSSLSGQSFLDFDGLLPFQENDFCKDDILSLKITDPCDFAQNNILSIRCRYFTSEELRNLEAKTDKSKHPEKDDSGCGFLHLVLCVDYINQHGFYPGQIVQIERIPFALSRVILAAKYDKKIIQEPQFLMHASLSSEKDEEIYVGKRSVVDLCGNIVDKVEYEVIKCEPVSQGIVDTHTTWVVLDASEDNLDENAALDICNMSTNCATPQTERFSNFSTAILDKSSLIIANFALSLKEIWSAKPQENAVKLKISVDYWSNLHHSFLNSRMNKLERDRSDSYCLYVSMETLVELGIQNGSWVKIWLCNKTDQCESEINRKSIGLDAGTCANSNGQLNNEEDPTDNGQRIEDCDTRTCHYGQLFEITPPEKALDIYFPRTQQTHVLELKEYTMKTRQTVHISSLLLFNLLQDQVNSSVYKKELFLSVAPVIQAEKTEMPETSSNVFITSLPYAQDAHISLINTPFAKPNDTFDDPLKRYFSKPRLLTVGDVVCIDYDGLRDSENSSMAEEFCNVDTIYFKVKKLVVSGKSEVSCLVDTNHTTVYQTTAVHSYVPIDAVHYVQEKEDRCNYWELPSPPGLDVPTSELVGIIEPYLKQNINMMPAVLMSGPAGVGKGTIMMAVGRKLGLCTMNVNCYDLIGESVAATESRINNIFQRATTCRPCILLLRNINILTKDREGFEDEPRITNTLQQCINNLKQIDTWPVVVIATSSSTTPLAAQLYSCFLHEVKIQTPTECERKIILESLASKSSVAKDVSFGLIAKRTAGMVLADFVSLVTKATNAACKRVSNTTDGAVLGLPSQEDYNICKSTDSDSQTENVDAKITQEDFEDALEIIRSEHSDAIGAPKIPNISWQDIGGLLDVKAELLDTIQLPLQHPELFASGLRRSGVLLYGPPGTGKTLLAKAVATECSLNFLSVKGPELINMYVGQSEENVRQVFSRAQNASPCVIFFDELDSLAPNRGRSGDSGGVMDRVVSQLLAELDGLHKSCDVFVIGATNRPDLLDPALLRPGRFDKLLYLGISDNHEAQLKILKALTKKFELDPDCNLEDISKECPLNYTGADLYALCSDAMLHTIKRMIADQTDVKDEMEASVKVKAEDFYEALQYLTPSVPERELKRYQEIQQQFTT